MSRQYYRRVNGCNAKSAYDSECICWHDEGDGVLPPEYTRHWRDKPTPATQAQGVSESETLGIVPQNPLELERNAALAETYKAERDAVVACLDHLRERDWFKDPLEIGSVVCSLPADATRKALTNLTP